MKFGNITIGGMSFGSVKIGGAKLGDTLVYTSGQPVQIETITLYPSSYDTTNSVYQSWQANYPASNSYTGSDSTTYSSAKWTNGELAETKIYWKFDTSSIPVGATIKSITITVKASLSAVNYQTGISYFCVCNGTTEVGEHKSINSTNAYVYTMDVGSGWTRDSIQNLSLLFHTQRSSSNTTANYYQKFYGATLTITYTLPSEEE